MKRSDVPKVEIADLTFVGSSELPISDQDQIATSLKQRAYSGDIEGVTSEAEERVRRAWQQHGYFKVQAQGKATPLTTSPTDTRIAVIFEIDEGAQYRLAGIAFKNNKAITNIEAVRALFPITDGDIFNSAQVGKGLEELNRAYGEFGYINVASVPETRIDEAQRTIRLEIDVDEGKQFYVSSIHFLGLDENVSQSLLNDFLLRPGDVYNQRLLELSMKRLATASRGSPRYRLRLDEKAGTVAIDLDLHGCPPA